MKLVDEEYEQLNFNGSKLEKEFKDAIYLIFKKYLKEGYKSRDIELILIRLATEISLEEALNKVINEQKEEK